MQNSILIYTLVVFVATIVPGPSMILALNHGIKHGVQKTMVTGLGNLTGNLILASVSMAGLGAIILASTPIFNIIRWLGAAYLIYIGLRSILSKQTINTDDSQKPVSKKHGLFATGFLVAISNPKGIVFFTALFPQFIHIEQTSVSQFIILLFILAVIAIGCFMLYAVSGSSLKNFFANNAIGKYFSKLVGVIFISFGLGLIFSR